MGSCECDPLDPINLSNDQNCGCHGPCPSGAICESGLCQCTDPGEALCDDACKLVSECLCEPSEHINDRDNCACEGPCALGDHCVPCSDVARDYEPVQSKHIDYVYCSVYM